MKPTDRGLPGDMPDNKRKGEDDMAVNNKELQAMKEAQRKLTKEQLRTQLLQKSVERNSELLQRLSKT